MRRALTAAEVKQLEAPHLAAGAPLMQRAAQAVADAVVGELRSTRGDLAGARVLVLVGGGANGGDGLFAAAILAERGARVSALVLSAAVHPTGLHVARGAGAEILRAPGTGFTDAPPAPVLTDLARWSEIIVDGAVGTGAKGPLRGAALEIVEALRAAPRRPVVAIDVPSGVGVDDGTLPGPALHADLTVTMIAAKPALFLPPAAGYAGRVQVADLGVAADGVPRVLAPEWSDAAGYIWTPTWDDHKYSRGVLGVVAGSDRYPGAAVLVVGGALRTGLGMVRHLVGGRAADLALAAHPEVVGEDGRVQALVLGPGVGTDATDEDRGGGGTGDSTGRGAAAILREQLDRTLDDRVPAVLDAGALDLLPDLLDGRDVRRRPIVLTPHAGEAARLLAALRGSDVTREEVAAAPAPVAEELAERTGAVVLLKGARTLVAGGGPLRVASTGVPWLATAGAGDVLAGIVGALLATGAAVAESAGRELDAGDVADAAVVGALLHGMAGHRAAGPAPGRPITASDVVGALPDVLADLLAGRDPAGARGAGPGDGLPGRFGRRSAGPGTLTR